MLNRYLCLITIFLTAAAMVFAQGTFTPRDADEEQAWRLHNEYMQSRKNETDLRRLIAMKASDINTMAVGVIPLWIDAQDVKDKTRLRSLLQNEISRQTALKADWDKKFYGRYGNLQDADETIVDKGTGRTMDKIEFRLINFPFNDAKKKEPPPPNLGAGGSWTKVREKLWTYTSTPNDPDARHEQSGAPYELTYVMDYYDRNGTQRWLKDTSQVSCKLDLLNADQVAPGQKVKVSCSMSYKGERITSGVASVWAGDLPIQTPGGFKPDGSIYPFWGYRTDAVLRVSASNDSSGQAAGQFSFPLKPRTDNEPFCIRLTSGIAGTAAVEVCYEWQAREVVTPDIARKWDGQWQSTWGNIAITQTGNNITGTYEHDNGRIVGTIAGNKIVGKWSEGPTFTAPNDAGDFEFTLLPDGKSFTGRWRYGSTGAWQTQEWMGTRGSP